MLGDYMIESALEAEKQQWPTVRRRWDAAAVQATANIETDEYVAELRQSRPEMAKERLWLICKKCLATEAVFVGELRI